MSNSKIILGSKRLETALVLGYNRDVGKSSEKEHIMLRYEGSGGLGGRGLERAL